MRYLSPWWDRVRTSLWFVPSLMMLAGGVLAVIGISQDLAFSRRDPLSAPWWLHVSDSDDAQSLVSTIMSSMIAMTSLVFSITMVVLTLAAQQFGPRLLRNFMASLLTQVMLGTFVMTIIYCLMVLSSLGIRQGQALSTFPSVTIAVLLAALSIVLLVIFIHALARSMVSETVIERVGRELDAVIGELEPHQGRSEIEPSEVLPADFAERAFWFGPEQWGYVQSVDFPAAVELARQHDLLVALSFQAGDYLAARGRGIAIYPREKDSPLLRRKLLDVVNLGLERTPVQDLEYSIRHLVEIAVRALSPAINDPYTAVAVIHRLSASLSLLMSRKLPSGLFRDPAPDCTLRLVCPQPGHPTLLGSAFDQIRQQGASQPIVVLHLLEGLSRIAEHAVLPTQVEALYEHARQVAEDAEREVASSIDRAVVRSRLDQTLRALQKSKSTVKP